MIAQCGIQIIEYGALVMMRKYHSLNMVSVVILSVDVAR